MQVYVATYEHRHGNDLRVFSDIEAAKEWKREVAEEWWFEWFDENPPYPMTDTTADSYFESREDEWFSIQLCTVETKAD